MPSNSQYSTAFPYGSVFGFFGSGIDGSKTLTGSTTIARDMYYTDLTLTGTANLNTAGFKIFSQQFIDIGPSAIIHYNGNNGAGLTAGIALSTNTVGAGAAGGNSSTTTGSNGSGIGNAYGGSGGAGGLGSGGAGGNAGAVTYPTAANGSTNFISNAVNAIHGRQAGNVVISGGAGGGGGGGDSSVAGSGGGGGAGCVFIATPQLIGTGQIQANGGTSANAGGTNCGTGGGGGGGWISLLTQNDTTVSGGVTVMALGGAPGTPTGTGVQGATGVVGIITRNRV